jgi:hypothetical protein
MDVEKIDDLITVSGQAPEAMDTCSTTFYAYDGPYHSRLLACLRIEVGARNVIYAKTRYG